jgi:hypothetical protein
MDNHGIIIGTLKQVTLGIEEDVNYLSRLYNNMIKHKEMQTLISAFYYCCAYLKSLGLMNCVCKEIIFNYYVLCVLVEF